MRPNSLCAPFIALLLLSTLLWCTPARAQCDFSSDFSSTNGWTQVGSEVEIQNGAVHFLNGAKCREFQKRLQAPIGRSMNEGDCWEARIEFTPVTVGTKYGLPYSGHMILSLTEGTDEFYYECNDPPCTGHNKGDQDGIMVGFNGKNPPDGNLYFFISVLDSLKETQSTRIVSLPLGTTHYVALRKSSANSAELSVYSDPNYSVHLPGSPVSLTYSGSVDNLTHVQFGNTIRGESRRQLTGTLDNLCLSWASTANISLDLPEDTTLCPDDTLILDIGHGSNLNYSWSNGSSDSIIEITEAGNYIARISSACNTITDTIEVSKISALNQQLNDVHLCEGESAILRYTAQNATYLWNTGATTPSIRVSSSGLYSVTVKTACETLVDQAYVYVEDCTCEMKLPNIFTPNGDGINDYFRAVESNPNCTLNLQVFNRWGTRVFETSKHDFTWNGDNLPEGTYFWVLTYADSMGVEQIETGSVTLSR
ncbi:gliding motility-associated C-terminal domain-containing protein [Phaeocystidibacter marisrubri]|uniref:Gliding motility-associated C-terminal domain-containing protein n=1 Tax=Phaeocystidibacter marisrubri TaxID=1577780 RepID=A0A6L3ZDX8_9FLAO|nr:gliding motility-associated C-terminal domain-containing protein [Phaeocystidibacter marisrubri]KAB2815647.1 gliding motility-associated C-terminal domain-containing protein [Phaeocystidibacter marisrubri]